MKRKYLALVCSLIVLVSCGGSSSSSGATLEELVGVVSSSEIAVGSHSSYNGEYEDVTSIIKFTYDVICEDYLVLSGNATISGASEESVTFTDLISTTTFTFVSETESGAPVYQATSTEGDLLLLKLISYESDGGTVDFALLISTLGGGCEQNYAK